MNRLQNPGLSCLLKNWDPDSVGQNWVTSPALYQNDSVSSFLVSDSIKNMLPQKAEVLSSKESEWTGEGGELEQQNSFWLSVTLEFGNRNSILLLCFILVFPTQRANS